MTMSDRVAVMNEGHLEQVGPPKTVYDEPATEFVGSFIGQPTTQFFDGRIVERDGDLRVRIDDYDYPLPRSREALSGYVGEPVRVGIRPQYLSVEQQVNGHIPATHLLDEPLGDATHSFFETEFGEVTVVTHPDFEGDREEYGLAVDPREVLLFDPDSGVQIGTAPGAQISAGRE